MVRIRLPDGSVRDFPDGTRALDVAESIGRRLARDAVAAAIDDRVIDLMSELPRQEVLNLRILTKKDPESLGVMRHSAAHVMARAVMRLFPDVKLAFGPTIENGFYYDFDAPEPLRDDHFEQIEAEMGKIIAAAEPFERFELPQSEAKDFCKSLGQDYKIEHIEDRLAGDATLSFYRQGEFVDLCRGPHLRDPSLIGAFKLHSLAGAYWKNDSSRKMLQRVYGTAWYTKKELDSYLEQIEEAKKRDHRVLGKQLQLFTIVPEVGSGLILWMPKGATVRTLLEGFIREELLKRGYQPVYTPNIGRLDLYRTSGHFPYYRDSQYPPIYFHPAAMAVDIATTEKSEEFLDQFVPGYSDATSSAAKAEIRSRFLRQVSEVFGLGSPDTEPMRDWLYRQEGYLAKPMNCPHHIQIYKAAARSYRDLPVRLAEFGTVYRFEQTGELSGMTRVRGFTQDDAHLFCTEEQVGEEFRECIELTQFILRTLGLEDYRVRLGLRDQDSSKYVGSPELWDNAENAISRVAEKMDLPNLSTEQGEAAFYGPKADFVVRDCLGREWQLGTVQLDYNLPERFELEYIGSDNRPHRPAMIHRAPLGSMERFIGILIEHYAGAFPLWLAPEQVRVLSISERFTDYARRVHAELTDAGLRAGVDLAAGRLGHKIRAAQLEKLPYMFVVGEKEQANQTVSVRDRIEGDLGAVPISEAVARLVEEDRTKSVRASTKMSSANWQSSQLDNEY